MFFTERIKLFLLSLRYKKMINLLLIILAIPGLVLLYFQWKIIEQQEQLIKAESESLKKLQKKNSRFVDSGIFGLKPESSYLQTSPSKTGLSDHRKKILSLHLRKNRKNKEVL